MLPIALALAQFAPMIAGWLGGAKAEDVAGKVVGLAQAVTGTTAPSAALQAIQADPNLAMKFQQAVLDQQVELAKIAQSGMAAQLAYAQNQDTQGAQTVRAEIAADSWITRNWRPLLMLLFGGIVANNYVIAPYVQAIAHTSVSLPMPQDLWDLLKIGIGGYIVSRGAEKSIATWKAAPKS